jgi:hypothetical protein
VVVDTILRAAVFAAIVFAALFWSDTGQEGRLASGETPPTE